MLKQLVLTIILSLFVINANAQKWYNKYYENKTLTDLDSTELSFLLENATKIHKIGSVVVISGYGLSGLGLASVVIPVAIVFILDVLYVVSFQWDNLNDFSFLSSYAHYSFAAVGVGLVVGAIGLPIMITGKKHQKEIKTILKAPQNNAHFMIHPEVKYNSQVGVLCPGLSISINF